MLAHTEIAYRVSLVLAAIELVTVVENVLIGGVEAGLHAVFDDLASTRWALQLLDLGNPDGSIRA